MSTPIPVRWLELGALRGDLRLSKPSPRPIHHPEEGPGGRFGGGR
jgi:hypothetical protein